MLYFVEVWDGEAGAWDRVGRASNRPLIVPLDVASLLVAALGSDGAIARVVDGDTIRLPNNPIEVVRTESDKMSR